MNKLLECTKGPWEATRPVARGTGHNWTIRANGTVCVAESGRWLNSDPHTESRANAALIAAAFDHALIGWAMFHGMIEVGGMFDGRFNVWMDGTPPTIRKTDPFGFPRLDDALRQRLLDEMKGAAE